MDLLPTSNLRRLSMLVLALFGLFTAQSSAQLSADHVARAKQAMVLVTDGPNPSIGLAISSTGSFVTFGGIAPQGSGRLFVLTYPIPAKPKPIPASVIYRDEAKRFAIISAAVQPAPLVLPFADETTLVETQEAFAFFNSENIVGIKAGRITAIARQLDAVERIEMEFTSPLPPTGGPVLNPKGELIGLAVPKKGTPKIAVVTPASILRKSFEAKPRITVTAPPIAVDNLAEPVEVTVSVDWIIIPPEPPTVSVEVTTNGQTRKFDATRKPDGTFAAKIVPKPAVAGEVPTVSVNVHFERGSITGHTADVTIAAPAPLPLSKVSQIERDPSGAGFLVDGKAVPALPALADLKLDLGGVTVTLDATKATSLSITPQMTELPSISYRVVVAGKGEPITSEAEEFHYSDQPNAAHVRSRAASALPEKTEIALPSPLSDVIACEAGQTLLLHLKDARKIAVFDVPTLKIRGYVNLDDDSALVAGGARHLLVAYPASGLLKRYDLTTLALERTVTSPATPLVNLAMGSASPRIALLLSNRDSRTADTHAFDVTTMSVLTTAKTQSSRLSSEGSLRASADGLTFASTRHSVSPTGFILVTYRNGQLDEFYEHQSLGTLVPNFDGSIVFTSHAGVYTRQYVPIIRGTGSWSEGTSYIPAMHPAYFLSVPYKDRRSSRKSDEERIGIFAVGATQPLTFVPEELSEMIVRDEGIRLNRNDPMTLDKRYLFYPQHNRLLTIPPTNDKIVARPLDVRQMLAEKKVEYLYVTNFAPAAEAGKTYRHKLEATTDSGRVTFTLQSGPAGLRLSPDGQIIWDVPAIARDESVIVQLRNSKGNERLHTFQLAVLGTSATLPVRDASPEAK